MEKIKEDDRIRLLLMLSELRRTQELYLDSYADAAIVAANQVLSVRIDKLESGKDISGASLFMEIVLDMALGAAFGPVLQKLTSIIFTNIARNRLGFLLLEKSNKGKEFSKLFTPLGEGKYINYFSNKTAKQLLLEIKKEELESLFSGVEYARHAQNKVSGIVKKLAKNDKINKKFEYDLQSTSIVLNNATSYSKKMKFDINSSFDAYEINLLSPSCTIESANFIEKLMENNVYPTDVDLISSIKDTLILNFEFTIWLMIANNKLIKKYGKQYLKGLDSISHYSVGNNDVNPVVYVLGEAWTVYAISRFSTLYNKKTNVEQWVNNKHFLDYFEKQLKELRGSRKTYSQFE